MFDTLLYVSYSTLYIPDDEAIVESIVRHARRRNFSLGLTGALIFTHQRFAQYIEGPEAALAEVMASIRRDPRHRDIEIVMSKRSEHRRFSEWDMAYAGPSDLVASHVDALIGLNPDGPESICAEQMIRLMSNLARQDVRPEAA